MTEQEFRAEMKKRGFSDEKIDERLNEYRESLNAPNVLALPLEMWLQERIRVHVYCLNEKGVSAEKFVSVPSF